MTREQERQAKRDREKAFDAIRFDFHTGYATLEEFRAARDAYEAAGGKKA